jgi:hypothetical protein
VQGREGMAVAWLLWVSTHHYTVIVRESSKVTAAYRRSPLSPRAQVTDTTANGLTQLLRISLELSYRAYEMQPKHE